MSLRYIFLTVCVLLALVFLIFMPKTRAEHLVSRIIGGSPTTLSKYPWFVSLPWGCGGSLIGPRHILTAGHCNVFTYLKDMIGFPVVIGPTGNLTNSPEIAKFVEIAKKKNIPNTVKFGRSQEFTSGLMKYGEVRIISDAKVHPQYSTASDKIVNDVMILTLSEPSTQKPIQLYSGSALAPNTPLRIIGYGRSNVYRTDLDTMPAAAKYPAKLQTAVLKYASLQTCKDASVTINGENVSLPVPTDPSVLCTHGQKKSGCHGDSGGPLILEPSGRPPLLVGVVSNGPAGCNGFQSTSRYLSFFANVSHLRSWIESFLK